MIRILCVLTGYFLGCIQTAYLAGKIKQNIDIRHHGSGNAGTSNAVRVLGFGTGVIVFICDLLKAIIAFIICAQLYNGANPLILGMYGGLGAVLGHNFPVFLRFKGGKGIAASLGVLIALDWRASLIVLAVGVILIAATRFISLASMTMLILMPVMCFTFRLPPEIGIIALFLAVMALVQHRENIKRLIEGKERKFSFKHDPNQV
ncbi:MAG: glycerol-3-phosphate 1-O-acyltransferase PlsY [Clostridiales bacterium]|nr:glycerol-3-phosphate 1-O-acyltransferase PlsY [Clostridiales bacterium]